MKKRRTDPVIIGMVLVIVLLIALLRWSGSRYSGYPASDVKTDSYFYNLTSTAQTYYHEEAAAAIGWSSAQPLSKVCDHVFGGGPSASEALQCQIAVTVNDQNPQAIAMTSVLTSELRSELRKEGFQVSVPARVPSDSAQIPLLLGVAPDGCNATFDHIDDPKRGGQALEYSLSCANLARDVPAGFTYSKVIQNE